MKSTTKGACRSTIIRLEAVDKIYGTGNTLVRALDKVDLIINQGEYCSIMGASGSGKSTVMNIIGCLDRPSEGNYYLDDVAVAAASLVFVLVFVFVFIFISALFRSATVGLTVGDGALLGRAVLAPMTLCKRKRTA